MADETLRSRLKWSTREGLARFNAAVEGLFRFAIKTHLPDTSLFEPIFLEGRAPDITVRVGGLHVLIETKTTPEPGMLPPSTYVDIVQQFSHYRAARVYPKEKWLLATNFILPPHMEQKLMEREVVTFTFDLDESTQEFGERLCKFLTSQLAS